MAKRRGIEAIFSGFINAYLADLLFRADKKRTEGRSLLDSLDEAVDESFVEAVLSVVSEDECPHDECYVQMCDILCSKRIVHKARERIKEIEEMEFDSVEERMLARVDTLLEVVMEIVLDSRGMEHDNRDGD